MFPILFRGPLRDGLSARVAVAVATVVAMAGAVAAPSAADDAAAVAPAAPVAVEGAGSGLRPDGSEWWTARLQTTWNGQFHPSFHSPYSSDNSLTAKRDTMYTYSLTAHLGVRLWRGAEAYFNPEVVMGLPFTRGLVGLGGFTNGEITRAAGSSPQYYRQRLFLRQTVNLGGESERIEPDFNQLAGTASRRRFVVTAGNFSILDMFDDNEYAKDPRTQFMNWSNWTYGAYDYAADARGFGWGLVLEYLHDDWAFRIGRMTGPREPNGLPVDWQVFKRYGDQLEIGHRHELMGRTGHARVLLWRNRAIMSRFSDALAMYRADPSNDQPVLDARTGTRVKYGVGLNVDQQIADHAGAFLRVMKSDGRTETLAFTEIDSSLSTGVLFDGKGWHREHDSAGVALAVNALSAARRDYLQSGARSFFIGDGALRYRPETIFETFYSFGLGRGLSVTTDYQYIRNPAYNADRGPVHVFALRLHAELPL